MKRLLLTSLLFGLLSACKQSHMVCIGDALLIPDSSYVFIYNKINGIVIDSIRNDASNDCYPFICIYRIKGNFAKIHAYNMTIVDTLIDTRGWIETRHLGTNLSHYSETVPVMCKPDINSEVSFKIINPQWGDRYRIINAHNGWLYIQNIYNPKEYGWLAPEYQCNNPYTSCN